jgi:hypothetical protein
MFVRGLSRIDNNSWRRSSLLMGFEKHPCGSFFALKTYPVPSQERIFTWFFDLFMKKK